MRVQIRKWGNSLALRIPKPFAQEAEVREGSVVQLSVMEGRLVAAPLRVRKVRLKDLLARITKTNRHDEVDSGPAVGREVW
jgi:antitoxin MazE